MIDLDKTKMRNTKYAKQKLRIFETNENSIHSFIIEMAIYLVFLLSFFIGIFFKNIFFGKNETMKNIIITEWWFLISLECCCCCCCCSIKRKTFTKQWTEKLSEWIWSNYNDNLVGKFLRKKFKIFSIISFSKFCWKST